MSRRTIAIGDIHGCSLAFSRLIDIVRVEADDTVVTLGDYVNRGPDSRGVIDRLIALQSECTLVPLLGNHDQLLLHNRSSRSEVNGLPLIDLDNGLERFSAKHFDFLETCRTHYENESHLFVHANYDHVSPLAEQEPYMLMWLHLDTQMPKRHFTGKTAIVGHSSQRSGEILDKSYIVCIDTYCHGGGWLTALDLCTNHVWQVDRDGRVRDNAHKHAVNRSR
jgi:serine/threonine protein phosphatase 1